MGQPKLPRKKYDTPNHPWQGDRIKAEHEVKKKYGLKTKTEIWKAQSELRSVRGQARNLVSRGRNPDDHQAHQEAKHLLQRLHRSGYIGADATLNDVLAMDVERILGRRLQSQVYLKGLARTPRQARQFVSHGLVMIGDRRVTVPSYVVRREEEDTVQIRPEASIANPDHPVRPKAPGAEVTAAPEPTEAPAAPTTTAPEAQATPETEPAKASEAAATPDVAKEAEGAAAATEAAKAPVAEAEPEAKAAEKPEAEPEAAEEKAKAEEKPKVEEKAEEKPKVEEKPKAEAKPKAQAKPKAEPEAAEEKPEAKADAAEDKEGEA